MNIKPVILAGGLGSRLRPYTYIVPKPLLPIGERPIIELTMYWLRSFGLTEVAVALGWRGDLIRAYLGDGSKYGLKIHYVQEEKRLGTVAPLAQLKDWIGDKNVFMMNGDILTQMNLADFVEDHEDNEACLTVASRVHETRSPFGVIHLGREEGIEHIFEKPVRKDLISAGMYLLTPEAASLVPDKQYDMTELIGRLLLMEKSVKAYTFEQPWIAIEQAGDYQEATQEWIAWADGLEHKALQLAFAKQGA